MTVRCSVVVPTYRRPELLERCLAALAVQTLPATEYEVIVADDAASDQTCEHVAQWNARSSVVFRYVAVTGNHGPAAARNAGWRAAAGDIIAFTDDDCVPQSEWLMAGCAALQQPGVGAAWGSLVMPLPPRPTDYERDAAGLADAVFVTANCFCRRSALEQVGGFDERFTAAWREDSDLYFTLLEHGCRVVEAPRAVVAHPIRPAAWGISLRQQRKTIFDALLYQKHPRLYRQNIPDFPRSYYAITLALLWFAMGAASSSVLVMTAGGGVWCWLTARFCAKRLQSTSHAPAHVAEMIVTSMLIPPLSLYWRWRGLWRFRIKPHIETYFKLTRQDVRVTTADSTTS